MLPGREREGKESRLAGTGTLVNQQATVSILIAYVANHSFMLTMVSVIGTRRMCHWALFCFVCLALPDLLILF